MPSKAPEFIGRYQVVKELKSGGMGTVFLARDPRIGRHMGGRFVAIKVLQEFDDKELRARFEREADIAGTLDHRNIVQIYDRDEYDGRPFIVMEYVDGRTLGELIETGAVSMVRKLHWMESLCDGLACAHNAGVVHRDIKPANIMIRALDGVLKILDFGIARSDTIKVNMTRGILGTLNYMAPEQWESTVSVDLRADVFAAGAVFYELLSGEKAFPGVDVPSIYRQIASLEPVPLEKHQPNLDHDLIAIVNRCLEKRPADRFVDMDAVRTDLAVVRQRLTAHDSPKTIVRPARTYVADAQQALEHGDFTLALEACARALAAEPDNTVARDLEARARAAIQLQTWMANAREEFQRGALTAASQLVEHVLAANESHPDALSLRLEIDGVLRHIARERKIEAALARTHERLEAGALDEASAAVAELLALDPTHDLVAPLKARVDAAIADRRIAEENERARQAVADAERQFGAGQHAAAMSLLESYQPPHAIVTAALAELHAQHEAIERRRQEEERQRQEEERRRQEEERRIAAQNERARQVVADARRQFSGGEHLAALNLLETHRPTHADVTDALEAMRAELRELERRRAEALARKQEEERQRAEALARKQEEERQRAEALARKQEEERQRAEALARKQDEERQRAEALAKKQEEERQRVEADRKRALEIQEADRLERQRQKELEAERHRQEEAAERRKREQEQIEAARKEKEAEQQRLEEERRKQQEEERLRKQEEQRRIQAQKRAEEQARREEEKRRKQAEAAAAAAIPAAETRPADDLAKTIVVKPAVEIERPRPAPPPVPSTSGRKTGLDPRMLAAAAVIVIGIAIGGVIKWRSASSEGPASTSPAVADSGTTPAPPSPSSPDAAAQPPAVTSPPATAVPPSAEPVTPPVASDAPTKSAPPGKAEPGGTASAIDAQVAALRATAEQQWARDQRDQAMATLASARKLNPRDAEVARLARGFVTQIAGRAASAATAARNASAPDTAGSPLAEGLNRQRQAITLDRAGKADETVRAYGEAIDLFTKASAAAKLPAPTRGNTAPPATVAAPEPAATTTAAAARGTTTPPPAAVPAAESASAGRGPTPPPSVQPSPAAPPPPPAPAPSSTPANANAAGPANAGTAANAAATTVAAESAVRQVLQRYRNGYETLNAAAVQAVYPSMNAQRLQEVFKGYSSLKFDVVIDRIEITADGQTATVTGAITNAPVVKTGKAAPQRRRALFSLRKNGDGWLIRDVQQSN